MLLGIAGGHRLDVHNGLFDNNRRICGELKALDTVLGSDPAHNSKGPSGQGTGDEADESEAPTDEEGEDKGGKVHGEAADQHAQLVPESLFNLLDTTKWSAISRRREEELTCSIGR